METALFKPSSPKKPFRPKFKPIKREVELRKVGLAEMPDIEKLRSAADGVRAGLGATGIYNILKSSMDCASYAMDTIHQVRWTLIGPITDAAIEKNFAAEIDLFGNSKSVEGVAFVESTMPQNGELNTHMLACAIGFHLEPEPKSWVIEGNAWTHPTIGQAKPPSPDVYSVADVVNGALGPNFSGQTPEQFMRPAILQWGAWANYVAWHMVRAYDLRWAIGTKWNILDEVLRHTAYMPPNAQDGSSGNSEDAILAEVRRTNDYFDSLGTEFDFLKIDFLREGVLTVGGVPVGEFRPSRAFETAPVTYGGMDLRHMLRGNSEFRKLDLPYIIGAGIPIGLILQEVDSTQGDIMRDYLSVTQGRQGNGHIPPFIVDAADINFGGTVSGGNVMLEQSMDVPPAAIVNYSTSVFAERAFFKMGDLKLSMLVKGRELDGDLMTFLRNNADAREALCSQCECGFVNQ
jgi:hypothetical protein